MELFGRTADVEALVEFVLGGATRRAPLLLVTGEAGIGKTALLDAVVPLVEQRGVRVYRSGAVEYEADLTFGGLNQLLQPLRGELAAVSATHRQALEIVLGLRRGRLPSELVIGAAVLALVEAVATTRTVVVVDDAALLDRASAMAIAYVARRANGDLVRFVLTARDDVENAFVRSGFDVYPLERLSEHSADALLAARFPELSTGDRRRVRDAAAGNPLALLDLPVDLGLRTESLPEVVPLADRLRALYVHRLQLLPAATREALLFVALAGAETDAAGRRLLALAAGRGDLARAQRLGLVRIDPAVDRVDFRHPLVRAAVVESSSPAERRRAHAELADAFRDDPRRRAWHLGASASWPDPVVAAQLDGLADELLTSGDPGAAVSAVLRAAELTEDREDRTRRIARASYLGSAFTGDLEASEELLRQARADPTQPLPLDLVTAGAHARMSRDGDTSGAHRLLLAALEDVAGPLDAADGPVIEALHLLVFASIFTGRSDLWAQTQRQLERVRPRLPETLEVLHGGYPDAVRPDTPALRHLDEAVGRLAFVSDPLWITRVVTTGAHLDRVPLARAPLERVIEDGRAGGAVARQIQSLFLLAMDDWLAGRWDQLDARTEEGLQLSHDRGYTLLSMTGHYLRALVDAARGHEPAADQAVERLLLWAAPRGLHTVAAYASHIQFLRAIGRGDVDAAFRHAASVDPPGTIVAYHPTSFWMIFDLVEAAVRSGHEAAARAHVATALGADVGAVSSRLDLVVRGAAALVAGEDWAERYERALEVPEAEQFPVDQARIRLAYGERLRRERLVSAARTELAGAAATFARLGATPWLDRANRELRAAGGSGDPAGPTLTPQEVAIVRLVADGLTNKEVGARLFLSPRTVSTHLSHVFAKLGVTSRHDLAGVLDTARDG